MATAEAFVGREYGPMKYAVGLEKIREYASATGNQHPWHHDEEAAAEIGGVIAPPMFIVIPSFKPVLACVQDAELEIDLAKLVHGEQQYTFHQPIKAGVNLFTTGVIESVRDKGPMYFVKIRTETEDGDGNGVATGLWNLVIRH
jgi:acyl dehydratase